MMESEVNDSADLLGMYDEVEGAAIKFVESEQSVSASFRLR